MFVLRASSNSNLFAIGLNAVALCWILCSNTFAMDVTFMRSLGRMQHNLCVICGVLFWVRHKHIRREKKQGIEMSEPNDDDDDGGGGGGVVGWYVFVSSG